MEEDILGNLIRRLRTTLSPDLLHPRHRTGGVGPAAGHCYVASEALFVLLGGRGAGYRPHAVRHEGAVHWYLVADDGSIVDATADQFVTPIPYAAGRGRGFLTRQPCSRTREILRRMEGS